MKAVILLADKMCIYKPSIKAGTIENSNIFHGGSEKADIRLF